VLNSYRRLLRMDLYWDVLNEVRSVRRECSTVAADLRNLYRLAATVLGLLYQETAMVFWRQRH
jgi:hypothetical protein